MITPEQSNPFNSQPLPNEALTPPFVDDARYNPYDTHIMYGEGKHSPSVDEITVTAREAAIDHATPEANTRWWKSRRAELVGATVLAAAATCVAIAAGPASRTAAGQWQDMTSNSRIISANAHNESKAQQEINRELHEQNDRTRTDFMHNARQATGFGAAALAAAIGSVILFVPGRAKPAKKHGGRKPKKA